MCESSLKKTYHLYCNVKSTANFTWQEYSTNKSKNNQDKKYTNKQQNSTFHHVNQRTPKTSLRQYTNTAKYNYGLCVTRK